MPNADSSDGTGLVYSVRDRNGEFRVVRKHLTAAGDDEEIHLEGITAGHLDDVSPDGKYAILSRNIGTTNRDVIAVSLADKQEPVLIAASQANELYGRISPDGK